MNRCSFIHALRLIGHLLPLCSQSSQTIGNTDFRSLWFSLIHVHGNGVSIMTTYLSTGSVISVISGGVRALGLLQIRLGVPKVPVWMLQCLYNQERGNSCSVQPAENRQAFVWCHQLTYMTYQGRGRIVNRLMYIRILVTFPSDECSLFCRTGCIFS